MRGLISTALALYALTNVADSTTVKTTGQTVVLDGISYYIPAAPVGTLPSVLGGAPWSRRGESSAGWTALTVVTTDSSTYRESDLSSTVGAFKTKDDVFSEAFLSAVYVQYTGSTPEEQPTSSWSGSSRTNDAHSSPPTGLNGTDAQVFSARVDSTSALPAGPYFLSARGNIYQAWRLYTDLSGSFTETTIPTVGGEYKGEYRVLPANIPGQELAVAVPSRLYFTRTAAQPLAGVRLGVKDIFAVAGLRQSNGNRAWFHLYPPATQHSLPVQKLVDAGAIIVGKLKTSQFANGEEPTADWV